MSQRKTKGHEYVFRSRRHRGFSHGLRPGTDHDINCISCQREHERGQRPLITETPLHSDVR